MIRRMSPSLILRMRRTSGHLLLSVLNPRRRQKRTMRRELRMEPRMKVRQVNSSNSMAATYIIRMCVCAWGAGGYITKDMGVCKMEYISIKIEYINRFKGGITKGIGVATAIGSTTSDEFSHSVI